MKNKMSTGTFSPDTVMFEYQHNTEKLLQTCFDCASNKRNLLQFLRSPLFLEILTIMLFQTHISFKLHWSQYPVKKGANRLKNISLLFRTTTELQLHLFPFSYKSEEYNYQISCALCKMWKLCLPLSYNNVRMQSQGCRKYNVRRKQYTRFMTKQQKSSKTS